MSFFRNLTLFRFPEGFRARFLNVDISLTKRALRPCGPLELESRGWVSPYGRDAEFMTIWAGKCFQMNLGGESKLLPTATLNQHISEKVAALEAERGRPVGARERRKLKDDALNELLPHALVRPWRLSGYVDLERGWVVVDTSSRRQAEGFISALRQAVGGFPATSLEPEESPRALMTEWLFDAKLPEGWALGDECELKDPADNGPIVRARRQHMGADEIREHLSAGKQVTQLGLAFDERMRFVLDETLAVRKFKLLDIATEQLDKGDRESAAAELDARFVLMSGEVGRLLDAIETTFSVNRPESL